MFDYGHTLHDSGPTGPGMPKVTIHAILPGRVLARISVRLLEVVFVDQIRHSVKNIRHTFVGLYLKM